MATIFYPHLGPQDVKSRYTKDEVRKAVGIKQYAENEDHITSANEAHGFFGAMQRQHGTKGAPAKFHEAARAIVEKHGVSPEVARNYLDSKHGRHVGDRMESENRDLHDAMREHHGGTEKGVKKALLGIHNSTQAGDFSQYDETQLGKTIDSALTCENGGKCSKMCSCASCMKFAELVKGGTAKYDEEKEEDGQGFGVLTEADLARHREAGKKGEYIPKPPPPPREPPKEKNSEGYSEDIKNKDLGVIKPPLKATPEERAKFLSDVEKRSKAFQAGPLKDAQKERDCASCDKYHQEVADLLTQYVEHVKEPSWKSGPAESATMERDEPEHTAPHDYSARAHSYSTNLEWKHGSIGGYHEHAMQASLTDQHELAHKHHTLAADAHDAKAATFAGHPSYGSDDMASRQHRHAAYLHRTAALMHKYPEEKERDSLDLAGQAEGRVQSAINANSRGQEKGFALMGLGK